MRIGRGRGSKVTGAHWYDRPIVWGLAYLAMIVLFAFIYDGTADGFYQTSAMHEPSSLDNEFYVEQGVALGAERAVQQQCESCQPGPIDGLDVTASGADLLVTLGFPTGPRGGDVSAQIDIPERSLPSASNPGGSAQVSYSLLASPSASVSSLALQLFENYTNSRSQPTRNIHPTLSLTSAEMSSLQQLSAAAQGLVSGLPDQFWRMAYFSAVAQATLGFGDIVPVVTFSRILVTSQAVLGVVIIGLFLNALARRRSDTCTSSTLEPSGEPTPCTDQQVSAKPH